MTGPSSAPLGQAPGAPAAAAPTVLLLAGGTPDQRAECALALEPLGLRAVTWDWEDGATPQVAGVSLALVWPRRSRGPAGIGWDALNRVLPGSAAVLVMLRAGDGDLVEEAERRGAMTLHEDTRCGSLLVLARHAMSLRPKRPR